MRKYIDLAYAINEVRWAEEALRSSAWQAQCAYTALDRVEAAGLDGDYAWRSAERKRAAADLAAAELAAAEIDAALAEARALDPRRGARDRRAAREGARATRRVAAWMRARIRAHRA